MTEYVFGSGAAATSAAQEAYVNAQAQQRKQQLASQIATINSQLLTAAKSGGAVYGVSTNPLTLSEQWLAEAITGVTIDLTLQGAPQIEIDFVDTPDFALLGSPLFQPQNDLDGRLVTMCINYPQGTDYWWALSQLSPQADYVIQSYWVPWSVYKLMHTKKATSTNLSKMTRAQFVQSLVDFTNKTWTTPPYTGLPTTPGETPIYFNSKQLNVLQPIVDTGDTTTVRSTVLAAFQRNLHRDGTIDFPYLPSNNPNYGDTAASRATATTQKAKAKAKTRNQVGLTYAAATTIGLTACGAPLTAAQCDVITTIMQVADKVSSGRTAAVAAIYAAMGESDLGASPNTFTGASGSYGVFQSSPGYYDNGHNLKAQAYAWFTGGACFQSGGGKVASTKYREVWQVANAVEANKVWNSTHGDSYAGRFPKGQAQGIQEAEAIVTASGGSSGPGGLTDGQEPSGNPSNANGAAGKSIVLSVGADTDYWTAINQIAQDVDWEALVDGDYLFFDSDVTLTRSPVTLSLKRTDPSVQNWSYDWDDNNVVTNFQLAIFCDEFDYVNGDVFQLIGEEWGPAANGSTIGLPGRWLISEVQRNPQDTYSSITLVQPQQPLNEDEGSATGTAQSPASNSKNVTAGNGTPQAVLFAARNLSGYGLPYDQAHRVLTQNLSAMRKAGYGMDCSMSTSWCLLAGGYKLPGGVTWGQWAPTTRSDWQSWGLPGRGQFMTVWLDPADHMFIEFYVPGNNHTQMNTSYQDAYGATPPIGPGSGPRYFAWGQNGKSDAASGLFVALHQAGM